MILKGAKGSEEFTVGKIQDLLKIISQRERSLKTYMTTLEATQAVAS
ncbi:hypothetical protein K2X30_05630 [bacterium]|nr:hypothetical protein [bacterium]